MASADARTWREREFEAHGLNSRLVRCTIACSVPGFGLPVLASGVGALKDGVVERETGIVFRPEDPVDLARTIERYFASDLYQEFGSPATNNRRLRDDAALL